jgi:murein DD-endopeptidase MepM/ murein hydrolase activator NlpD
VRAAALCALLSVIASFVPEPPPRPAPASAAPAAPIGGLRAVCGMRAIPEGDACIPLPSPSMPIGPAEAGRTPPTAKDDTAAVFLPRRPDRPPEYTAYTLPIEASPVRVLSEAGGAGPSAQRALGERTGVDFAVAPGDRVTVAAIEGQEGDARVVFVGEDVGVTVATLHSVRDGDVTRSIVMIYGHLDRPGPGIVVDTRVNPGGVIGFGGDTGSTGIEQLYLEARVVRDGALPRLMPDTAIPRSRLADDALSIATDVRNVLAKK